MAHDSRKYDEMAQLKNKHLTEEMRVEIQDCLCKEMDFKVIARRIRKDPTTVSREVKRHMQLLPARSSADNRQLCERLLKPPFVCNACERRSRCMKERRMYYARKAQIAYHDLLSECRSGIALNRQEFYDNDAIIKQGIEAGQHVYHIVKSRHLNVSISSVYRYIKQGYSSVSAIDLPRAVKFKPRKQHPLTCIPAGIQKGRSYDCFKDYIHAHQMLQWLEMDTVIGRPGGKTLLTFSTTYPSFMFARLAQNKSAVSISAEITNLKKRLLASGFRFGAVFPVVLTDNGGEFANVSAVEIDLDGQEESRLFFCEPYRACQKPHVEKGHTLLRDILPKGSSFDQLTQEQVDLVFSHINAVVRHDLGDRSPYDVFSFLYGRQLAAALGIRFIPPDEVNQRPSLLK